MLESDFSSGARLKLLARVTRYPNVTLLCTSTACLSPLSATSNTATTVSPSCQYFLSYFLAKQAFLYNSYCPCHRCILIQGTPHPSLPKFLPPKTAPMFPSGGVCTSSIDIWKMHINDLNIFNARFPLSKQFLTFSHPTLSASAIENKTNKFRNKRKIWWNNQVTHKMIFLPAIPSLKVLTP